MADLTKLTKAQLEEKAASFGLTFREGATKEEMIQGIEGDPSYKADQGIDGNAPSPDNQQGQQGQRSAKKVYYYWLKASAYTDDDPAVSNTLLRAGFYRFDAPLKRFEGKRQNPADMVVYEGRPTDLQIQRIAESRGIKLDETKEVNYDELLEKLLNK